MVTGSLGAPGTPGWWARGTGRTLLTCVVAVSGSV